MPITKKYIYLNPVLTNILTRKTQKLMDSISNFGCHHHWTPNFSYLIPISRIGIYLDMSLKSLKIRLSVSNTMHPKGEVSSEEW